MSEVIKEAHQSHRHRESALRLGGGLATFGFFTALGYKLGTDIFAKDAPSQGLEYAYTAAGVTLGMIGGGFAGTIVATVEVERSSLRARVRSKSQIAETPPPAPVPLREEVQLSDDLSHMLPHVGAAEGVYDDDPDLNTLQQLSAEQLLS